MFLWWKMRERACILNMVVVKLGQRSFNVFEGSELTWRYDGLIVTICALIGKRLCLFVKFFHSVFAVGFWFDGG